MYKVLIDIHVWTSILFVLVALIVCIKSFNGLYFNKVYTTNNKRLEILFIILLYMGLVLGFVLYFFINAQSKQKMLTLEESMENASAKFWAIEHFCIMLLALIIAQIGKIFTGKNISDKYKFKYALFYYGLATIITFISTGIYIYHKIT